MRRALIDGTVPDQIGHGLGMVHHYRTPTTTAHRAQEPKRHRTQVALRIPRRGLVKPEMGSPLGETIGLPKSIERLRINTERQVRSKGTPHVGHADSITNDEHGSWSDISDWSSPNPVTRVVKVKTNNPLYFHIIISYIHTRHHPIRPCLPDDSGPEPPGGSGTKHRTCSEMHHNTPCCITKRRLPHST